MPETVPITDLISFRRLAKLLDVDRKAIAAIVEKQGLPVVTHLSQPRAKLLGPAEVAAVRAALTPAERRTA